VLEVPKDIPDEPMLITKAGDTDDLAITEGDASEPNILEEPDDDAPAPVQSQAAAGPKVPNFHGMTMREVLEEAASRGFTVVPDGSGVARGQSPAPGAVLRQGQIIRVQFTR